MQTILRARINALINPERHQIWQWMLAGCAMFWIVAVIAVMGIR
ncbi:hypothetical protein QMZ65_13055 [Pantoea sp. EABMAA-21]|jgi:hypothetical protein|nr:MULTISPECIES: hypothetical protein [unclassified Pantoea]MDI9278135.1 hypothetical protein [Pantoea sp. EABMAA-21]SNY63098.1 hypothetical protein SAMN02744778_01469 [Pantoea sp. GL120224-02]